LILRHVTLKRRLIKIYNDGYLDPTASSRKLSSDNKFIAFELNPKNETLIKIFHVLKSNPLDTFTAKDVFELTFDGNKMIADGKVLETLTQNKYQLINYIKSGFISQQEYDSIGDFIFVKGKISLDYLTKESKNRLEEFIKTLGSNK
jgi:uncharacterized protein YbgA (DUF1722 family)